jgi:hypothetical protein
MCVEGSLKSLKRAKEMEEIKYKDSTDIYNQFSEALEENMKSNFPYAMNVSFMQTKTKKRNSNILFNMPDHLVQAYYLLRHLNLRDYKIKIQYIANYFRSVQKRLALELDEMETRDRILGDLEFKPPGDASRISVKNISDDASVGAVGNSRKQQLAKARAALAEEDNTQLRDDASMVSSYQNNLYERMKQDLSDNDISIQEDK